MINESVCCVLFSDGSLLKLGRAVNSFISQTYENKFLIVVCSADMDLQPVLSTYLAPTSFRTIFLEKNSLTSRENYFIKLLMEVDYKYICMWDENEWSHRNRIWHQVQALELSQKVLSVILYPLIYNSVSATIFALPPYIYLDTALFDREAFLRHPKQDLERLFTGESPSALIGEACPVDYGYLLIKIYGKQETGKLLDHFYEHIVRESDILSPSCSTKLCALDSPVFDAHVISDYLESAEFSGSLLYVTPPVSKNAAIISFKTNVLFDHCTIIDAQQLLSHISSIKRKTIWKCKTPTFSGAFFESDNKSLFGYSVCDASDREDNADEQAILAQIKGTLCSLNKVHKINVLENIEFLCLHTLSRFEGAANLISDSVSMIKALEGRNITHLHAARYVDFSALELYLKKITGCKIWHVETGLYRGLYAESAGLVFFAFAPSNENELFEPSKFNQSIDARLSQELIEFGFANNIKNLQQLGYETFNDLIVIYNSLLSKIAGCDIVGIAETKIINSSINIQSNFSKIIDDKFSGIKEHLSYFSWIYFIEISMLSQLCEGASSMSLHDLATNTGHFPYLVHSLNQDKSFDVNLAKVDCSDINPSLAQKTIALLKEANGHPDDGLIGIRTIDVLNAELSLEQYEFVTANDIIEHFDEQISFKVLENIFKNCTRYLIVHVPIETTANKMFGHFTTFSREKLSEWASRLASCKNITERFHHLYSLCPDTLITDGFLVLEKIKMNDVK